MPEGDRRGEVDFHDYKKDGMLYKGLGQLADGEYGQDNFRLDLRGRGIKVIFVFVFVFCFAFRADQGTHTLINWR